MSGWVGQLMILPILLPLLAGAAMVLLGEQRRRVKAALGVASVLAVLGVAVLLLWRADAVDGMAGVYRLGDWPAPFGIVLVVDRLSAMMVLLASILALAALVFSLANWHRAGPHFHPLFQFLLMGLNGAFLTGDVFNLFVFFEILLAASYGLALYGAGIARIRAGLHYIAVNLSASLLFLIGAGLLYGAAGTLNMADLAARLPMLTGSDRALFEAGAAILGTAFLVKAGMWPLGFWLAPTYAVASPPAAAIFAIMSKVGVYAVLRLWLLLFGAEHGSAMAFGADWLLFGGIVTVGFGAIGVLATQDMGHLAGSSILVSSGTLLAAIGVGQVGVTAGALFYLVSSTLAICAFFLLIELVERDREASADVLAVTLEAFGEGEAPPDAADPVGTATPVAMAMLGISFVCCALLLAGLPPLSGFIAKFAVLTALLNPVGAAAGGAVPAGSWALLAVVIFSGFTAIVAMTRAGIRVLWSPLDRSVPEVRGAEIAPIALLLLLCLGLTVQAGPVMRYMQDAAVSLYTPLDYVRSVLPAAVGTARPGGGGA